MLILALDLQYFFKEQFKNRLQFENNPLAFSNVQTDSDSAYSEFKH